MSDNQTKEDISKKIKSEIRKYEILKKAFLKLYESENKAKESRNTSFDKLSTLKETNSSLQNIYTSFLSEMKEVEEKRGQHLNKINNLFLPVIDYYPKRLKETKENLENFEKEIKRKEKLEKSRNEIRNEPEELGKYNEDLATSRREVGKQQQNLEHKICNFEKERTADNKSLFLRFIYSELKYHANALELMNKLFKEINDNDPRIDLEEFVKNYGLTINFRDFGIDMKELIAKKSRMEKKKQEMTNDVYKEDNDNDSAELKKSINED